MHSDVMSEHDLRCIHVTPPVEAAADCDCRSMGMAVECLAVRPECDRCSACCRLLSLAADGNRCDRLSDRWAEEAVAAGGSSSPSDMNDSHPSLVHAARACSPRRCVRTRVEIGAEQRRAATQPVCLSAPLCFVDRTEGLHRCPPPSAPMLPTACHPTRARHPRTNDSFRVRVVSATAVVGRRTGRRKKNCDSRRKCNREDPTKFDERRRGRERANCTKMAN